MTRAIGVVLLGIAVLLFFVGRERADGTRMMPMPEWFVVPIYPAICLTFFAFGAALLISGE